MTIGVIITVYNLEKFAGEAIESVLAQTLKPDRILVVNDGSTDKSLDVINTFQNQLEIINHTDNRGVLPSVIEGIRLLKTDIVALLDGDDVWEKTKLREVYDAFLADETSMMVLHNFLRIDAAGSVLSGSDVTQHNLSRIAKADPARQDELLKESILSYRGVWLGSALSFRTSMLDVDSFDRWSLSLSGHELSHQDQPLAAFLIAANPRATIIGIPRPLFRYRLFGENSSGTSGTLPKALRTLQRSRATLIRTHALAEQMPGREESCKRQEHKLMEISYLEALYTGSKSKALILFISLALRFWPLRACLKEFIRLMGVFIMGPSWFLSHK